MENNKWKLNILIISAGFEDSDSHIALDNSNTSDDKWNRVAGNPYLDVRLFSETACDKF